MTKIDATDVQYRDLNERIHKLVDNGEKHIELRNVCGQKFIGDALKGNLKIDVYGIPATTWRLSWTVPRSRSTPTARTASATR